MAQSEQPRSDHSHEVHPQDEEEVSDAVADVDAIEGHDAPTQRGADG